MVQAAGRWSGWATSGHAARRRSRAAIFRTPSKRITAHDSALNEPCAQAVHHDLDQAAGGGGRDWAWGHLGPRVERRAAAARGGRARGTRARRGGPGEEIERWRILRATSGSVRVATQWRRPPHLGQRMTSTAQVRWRSSAQLRRGDGAQGAASASPSRLVARSRLARGGARRHRAGATPGRARRPGFTVAPSSDGPVEPR